MTLRIDKELFQWEKNRFLFIEQNKIDPIVSYVQFYNKNSKKSLREPIVNNEALIPNSLLKENLPIVALVCTDDSDGEQVVTRKVFKVLGRPKPEHYIDDDQENPDGPGADIDIIYDGGVEV